MTFDEYNTDEYFNNKDSTADGLIKAAYDEGKTREEVEKSLSPLWKEDKKGNVKKALDTYYKTEEPKAEEQKPTEEKVTEKVIEETAPTVNKQTEEYMNSNNAISYTQEDAENKRQSDELGKRWDARLANIDKMTESMKNIDDHMVEQLPTFMFKRYQNGEFGDPKSSDAKLRLAHFMINGVGTALSNMSHVIRKDGVQEQSDAEKYQQTNLEEGLKNRWKKNNAETEEVIKIANKEADNEQDARIYVEQLTRDNMLKSGWNAMDQNQKLYAINVSREIGKMIGDMNVEELSNFITAQALNGNLSEQQAVVVGLASLVSKTPELLQKMPEGGVKSAVMSLLGIGK